MLMNRARKFELLTLAVLLALVWSPREASAAQCGSTVAGFETWKRQFAGEAQARGVSATAIAALMTTNYSTATIAADRGQRSFSLSLNQFLAKRGGPTIVARGAGAQAITCSALHINPATVRCAAGAAAGNLGNGDRFRKFARKSERPIGGCDSRLRLPSLGIFHRSALCSSDTGGARYPFSSYARLHAW